ITTDSPAVEATSTRCQAVLEAFRGRAAAARRMIESARRTVTELGLRHALLEVEHFAGIVELVVDDPVAAEPHLRLAYNGFRRMGLDADTAETAALLGRTCLALGRDAEADELCTESERLAGHALKASIAWRTLRAHLLSRANEHGEARRVAEAAVGLAERTDVLVDHADACMALATVLGAAGDFAGARAAAERAVGLYERKGAAALAEKARRVLGECELPSTPASPEVPSVEPDSACARVIRHGAAAIDREAWDEFEALFAPEVFVESRRKITGGFTRDDFSPSEARRLAENGALRIRIPVIAVRGERLALTRLEIGTADVSPGAPRDEMLELFGLDENGRIALQVSFDVEDIDAAIAELDAAHARFAQLQPKAPLENTASRVYERVQACFTARDLSTMAELLADDFSTYDRRRVVNAGTRRGREAAVEDVRANAGLGVKEVTSIVVATRGERLVLRRARYSGSAPRPDAFHLEVLNVIAIDSDERIAELVTFEPDDIDAAIAELDTRYLAGEAAAHAHTWSVITDGYAALNRLELPPTTPDFVNIDHRRGAAFASGDLLEYLRAGWDLAPDSGIYVEAVHRLSDLGSVVTHAAYGTSREGFDAEWREVNLLTADGDRVNRCERFDEADLDIAITRFEELSRPTHQLENAASQADARFWACFAARDWNASAEILTESFCIADHRRVLNAGVLHGRDVQIENMKAVAEIGANITSTVIATRGQRLALARVCSSHSDLEHGEFSAELLSLVEIAADNRIAVGDLFDVDDLDAALAELDARYLAGEAAAHAHTWSVVAGAYEALNRRQLPATTPDWVNIDHRGFGTVEVNALTANIRAWWDLTSETRIYVQAVLRLSNLGATVVHATQATSREGLGTESREITLLTVEDGKINRCEIFDEADVGAAIARFEQLSRSTPRLENTAARVFEHVWSHFATGNWEALAATVADNYLGIDHRRVVKAEIQHGRDVVVRDLQAAAGVGFTISMLSAMAIRGERLVLALVRASGRDAETIQNDVLNIVEVDAEERIATVVVYDLEDIDAAVAELDARYLTGEADAHARTWSVITGAYAALNRREHPATTPDWVNIDHRRGISFAPGEVSALLANWNTADLSNSIEAVHRLNDLGAVVTSVTHESSPEGFEAEWRGISVLTVEGDLIDRLEVFDEADLDAATARLDQLSRPAPQPENAASQVGERFRAHFAAGDWDAMAETLADNFPSDDRRRVVGSGVRHGRDAQIEDMRAIADLFVTKMTAINMATRGERLVLMRVGFLDRHQTPEAFRTEVLGIAEINDQGRIVASVSFDLDDIDAALEELDARYLSGEAAAHARTWSIVAGSYAALNRHELPLTAPDCVYIDHRRETAFGPGDLTEYIRAGWDLDQDINVYIEQVHRLNGLGVIITYAAHETREGFDAEWRGIAVFTVEGDLVNRCEVFDHADLDTALARFEELSRSTLGLENAGSRAEGRLLEYFAARDWDAATQTLADDFYSDDRRRAVNVGVRHGRHVAIADMQGSADFGLMFGKSDVIATRAEHLALSRARWSGPDQRPEAFHTEVLQVVEVNTDERIAAHVMFDADDFDAAFAELDARHLAGEAAVHSHMWSVITKAYAALNRHELPSDISDWVTLDHRVRATFEGGDLTAYIRAGIDLTPNINIYVEAVHRLSDFGAVVTHVANGRSREGLDAEWRMIELLTLGGETINRCELFDEADLDAALARFEELHPSTRRPENAASQVDSRFWNYFMARDWPAMAELVAADISIDDRRRVVNAGLRHGLDSHLADMRAIAEVGAVNTTSTVTATRGACLALTHIRSSNRNLRPEEVGAEVLNVVEIDAEERIVARVAFDVDAIDAAFEELDARYLAGEAATHAHAWEVIAGTYAAFNRQEFAGAEWAVIDHRRGALFAASNLTASIRGIWDLTPDLRIHIEQVHRLSSIGALITHTSGGTSPEGFDAEWRMIQVLTVEGDHVNRCELFDEADLDSALARFDELSVQTRCLENAASQAAKRFLTRFAAGDWDAMAELLADNYSLDDRRRVV
ncbi:MAG: regulator, partial [Mycobacterium sp.]